MILCNLGFIQPPCLDYNNPGRRKVTCVYAGAVERMGCGGVAMVVSGWIIPFGALFVEVNLV